MSDATLPPPPRATSSPPASQDEGLHNSSSGEGEFDTSFDSSRISAGGMKEESAGDSEGRTDGKQKRKRTRYVSRRPIQAYSILRVTALVAFASGLELLVHFWSIANYAIPVRRIKQS